MALTYVVSHGISAVDLVADEEGVLVQSVDWSVSKDKTVYKSASNHGATTALQYRNPIMSIGIDGYMLAVSSGLTAQDAGANIAMSSGLSNYSTATIGSYTMGFYATTAAVIWENPSISADGEANPRIRGTAVVYPWVSSSS